ncbi:caspase family protein [Candidatus Pelagibacter sp.]|nr:caspase family protein [Candidatus Pelagibacter sp.]
MKRLLAYLFIVLGLGLNFNAYAAPVGKGQIQLSEDVVKSFIDYLVGDTGTKKSIFNRPSTFWITIDGSRSYWWYNPHGEGSNADRAQTYSDLFQVNEAITKGEGYSTYSNTSEEKAKCERHHGQSCSRFARGRYVSWNNGINPKGKAAKFSSKMSESEVRAKLTKLGFYNNDFLDTTTTPKITKKKETKKVEKKITKKTSQTQKVEKQKINLVFCEKINNYSGNWLIKKQKIGYLIPQIDNEQDCSNNFKTHRDNNYYVKLINFYKNTEVVQRKSVVDFGEGEVVQMIKPIICYNKNTHSVKVIDSQVSLCNSDILYEIKYDRSNIPSVLYINKNGSKTQIAKAETTVKPKKKVKVAKVEDNTQEEFKPPICASGEYTTTYIIENFKSCIETGSMEVLFKDDLFYDYYKKLIKKPLPSYVKNDEDIKYPFCNTKNLKKKITTQLTLNKCKEFTDSKKLSASDNLLYEIIYDGDKDYPNSKKTQIANIEEPKQEEFKPKKTNQDNEAPVITIAEAITVDSQAYTLKGKVKDKSQVYLTIDGRQVDVKKGKFKLDRFNIDPDVAENIKIVAIDKWNNRTEKTIKVTIDLQSTDIAKVYEQLKPNNIKVKTDKNKIAIIIGIEKYENLTNLDAKYANRDAKAFKTYATRALGIKPSNIKMLIDDKATRSQALKAFKLWLPKIAGKGGKDIHIFFAGHGLASDNGEDLYILPQDGESSLLEDTAISRVELISLINKVNPKSVTMFFDTCYSGQTRDERMLVASLRPIRIVADEQEKPDNFTIFTASNYDQTSGSIEEAEHGMFSYYLMKGLEGKADENKDRKITNGELITYLKDNVSQEAFTQNRQQDPMLAGDPDKILIKF